jgi:hypothetical protein
VPTTVTGNGTPTGRIVITEIHSSSGNVGRELILTGFVGFIGLRSGVSENSVFPSPKTTTFLTAYEYSDCSTVGENLYRVKTAGHKPVTKRKK